MRTFIIILALGALVAGAAGDSFVQTFDGIADWRQAGWRFGANNEIAADGGNPGPYLRGWGIDSVAPLTMGVGPNGEFTGNYRERMITSFGVDAVTNDVDWPDLGNRPLTLCLFNDSGTPDDIRDDVAAIYKGANIPFEDDGWLSYDYAIPYAETALPDGWAYWEFGPYAPEEYDWNTIIEDVDYILLVWGDPELFYIFQMWDIGIDNPRLTWVPEPSALLLAALGAATLLRRR